MTACAPSPVATSIGQHFFANRCRRSSVLNSTYLSKWEKYDDQQKQVLYLFQL